MEEESPMTSRAERAAALIERLTHRKACASCGVVVDDTAPTVRHRDRTAVPVCAECLATPQFVQVITTPAARYPHHNVDGKGKSGLYTVHEEFTESFVQLSELHRVSALLGLPAPDRFVQLMVEGTREGPATWTTSTVSASRGPGVKGTPTRFEFVDLEELRNCYVSARAPFDATHYGYEPGCRTCGVNVQERNLGAFIDHQSLGVHCKPCSDALIEASNLSGHHSWAGIDIAVADWAGISAGPGLAAEWGIRNATGPAPTRFAGYDKFKLFASVQAIVLEQERKNTRPSVTRAGA